MNGPLSFLELALLGQALLWLAVMLIFVLTRQASIYHPLTVYLLFHGLVFVVRPWTVHYLDFVQVWQYIGFDPSEDQLLRALAASSLALVVISTSMVAFGWSDTRFKAAVPKPFTKEQQTALVAVTLLLAPVVAYSIRTQYSGAFQVENRGGTYVMAGASGYSLEAQYMAGSLLAAWLLVKGFRWVTLLPIVPYVLYRTYAGMSRWTIVLLFLLITLIYAWQRRAKWPALWAILCAIPVFFLFKSIGDNRQWLADRWAGKVQETPAVQSVQDKLKTRYDSPDFANFDFLAYVVAVVPARTETYTYGAQYLQLFTEPIPRKLWPGKPVGAPVRLFNLNNYGNFLGMTPSLVGDGWMSGGWIGIIVTMTIVGGLLGAAHHWFWKRADAPMESLFYMVALALVPQWFRDGGISITKFLFWNLSPLVLWVGLSWLMGQRRVPSCFLLLRPGTRVRLLQREANPVQPHTLPPSGKFTR